VPRRSTSIGSAVDERDQGVHVLSLASHVQRSLAVVLPAARFAGRDTIAAILLAERHRLQHPLREPRAPAPGKD